MRYQTIAVERVVAETDKAFLLKVDGSEKWVPKSVIEDPGELDIGDEAIEAEVAEWFVKKEGL
jgi:hypothetical protein